MSNSSPGRHHSAGSSTRYSRLYRRMSKENRKPATIMTDRDLVPINKAFTRHRNPGKTVSPDKPLAQTDAAVRIGSSVRKQYTARHEYKGIFASIQLHRVVQRCSDLPYSCYVCHPASLSPLAVLSNQILPGTGLPGWRSDCLSLPTCW